jgi:hypothetical protein
MDKGKQKDTGGEWLARSGMERGYKMSTPGCTILHTPYTTARVNVAKMAPDSQAPGCLYTQGILGQYVLVFDFFLGRPRKTP